LLLRGAGELPPDCSEPTGDYIAASSLGRFGFGDSRDEILALHGKKIRIWGFVDHHNMYGDASAKEILGDWWSGDGPDSKTWRFNLKAKEDDPAGRSFAVFVTTDQGRDELLRALLADAQTARPTKVYLEGRLYTFDAPTNARLLLGLRLDVQSSRDIQLQLSGGR
jgi:hypothetical protein